MEKRMSEISIRVLLVEECDDVAESLHPEFAYDEAVWEVMTATSPSQAYRCLEESSPDLMIVISKMASAPNMEMLCRACRSFDVPSLILTSSARETDVTVVTDEDGMQYEVSTEFVLANLPCVARCALKHWHLKLARQYAEYQQGERLANNPIENHDLSLGEGLTEFIHEVSQPLAAVVNYAGMCIALCANKRIDNIEFQEALEHINQQAHRAGNILRRLQSSLSNTIHHLSNINLNQLVFDVAGAVRTTLKSQRARMCFQIRSQTLPRVRADVAQIHLVLLNLVQHALDAMNDVEPPQRRIVMTVLKESDEITFLVSDRGRGLASEVTGRVFDSCFSTNDNRLGLGLSISRRIIKQHGGRLWVKTNQDRGAMSGFVLPVNKPVSILDLNSSCQSLGNN